MIRKQFDWELKGTVAPGGTVLKVVADEVGRLWLASPAGLFCLEDGTWHAVRRGVPFWRVNTVAVNARHIWLAGMPGGILRSANGGQSWHRCWIEQTEAPVVAITPSPHFAQDRLLLAATDGDGILRSTDGGRHWELSNFGLREFAVLEVVMAPHIGRYEYAFAITESGFYHSPNGGRAWRLVEMGEIQPLALAISPNFVEDQMVCVGTEAGELFVSTDAGLSWHCVSNEFDGVNGLTFTADQTLLVGTETGIYHVLLGSPFALQMASFAELPSPILSLATVDDVVYAGLVDGLWLSVDNGRSWQPTPDLAARRMVWYLGQTADRWLVAGPEEGVWQTADSGQTWQEVWSELPVLAAATTEQQLWLSTLDGLIVSSDQAESWQLAKQAEEPLLALAVMGHVVWAGTGTGRVWRGERGEWAEATVPFAGQQLVGFLAAADDLLAVVWSAANNMLQLWRQGEEDNWRIWFSQSAGAVLPQVAVSQEGALVGLGSYVYHQMGSGWQRQRVATMDAPITAVCALPGGGWIMAVTDALLQSADGVEWKPVENGLRGESVVSLLVVGEQLVAGTADGKFWVNGGK